MNLDDIIGRTKDLGRYFLRGGYPYVWLSLLVLALYVKTLAFRFTDLDDYHLIVDGQHHLRGIADAIAPFTTSVDRFFSLFYRPFLQFSFMLDSLAGGKGPFVYHLSNVLFHAAACSALFALLFRMRYGRLFSFLAAAIFAVHPVLTQAVAWIPGRNDSLLALFVLLSMIFLVNYRAAPSAARCAFHQLFLFCALLTKETAVMAVPVFMLYLLVYGKEPSKKHAALAAGWFVSLGAWWMLRTNAIGGTGFGGMRFSLPDSAAAFVQYVGKMLFPVQLSPYPVFDGTVFAFGIAALIVIAGLLLLSRERLNGRVLFGLSWLALFLAPSFIQQTVFYEHRAYLPLMGLIFILPDMGGALKRLAPALGRAMPVFGAAVAVCFFVMTFVYSDIFISRAIFAETAVTLSPRCAGAFINLGNYYQDIGQPGKALDAYLRAREIDPSMAMACFNAGEVHRRRGDHPAAIAEYERALALDANYADARKNLELLKSAK